MKMFKYEVLDEDGYVVRKHNSRWDAYNHARSDKSLKVKVNNIPKVNRFLEAYTRLGECLI